MDDQSNVELKNEIFKQNINGKKERSKDSQENQSDEEDDLENDIVNKILKEKGLAGKKLDHATCE